MYICVYVYCLHQGRVVTMIGSARPNSDRTEYKPVAREYTYTCLELAVQKNMELASLSQPSLSPPHLCPGARPRPGGVRSRLSPTGRSTSLPMTGDRCRPDALRACRSSAPQLPGAAHRVTASVLHQLVLQLLVLSSL